MTDPIHAILPDSIEHIAVIAPAGPPDPARLADNAAWLRAAGRRVTVMPHVQSGSTEGYLAADWQGRLEDLHACWLDESVDLVLCARGGFGSAHLLPHIDWALLRSRPLPLIGYSDITALHLAMLANRAGVPIAAPMAGQWRRALQEDGQAAYSIRFYAHALRGGEPLPLAVPESWPALQLLKPAAPLTGLPLAMNLVVGASLAGTPYWPDCAERILIIEEVNEPVYKLDRALTQLAQSGVLRRCRGVIFGDFVDCGTPEARLRLFDRFLPEIVGPVAIHYPFGHRFPMAALNLSRPIRWEEDQITLL